MGYHKQIKTEQDIRAAAKQQKSTEATRAESATGPRGDGTIQRAMRHIAAGHYERALDLLRSVGQAPPAINAIGVCLLRLGRFEEAIRILRGLVLNPGCTWMRPDLPITYKVNFATALLLGGQPAGCREILSDIKDDQHPSVERLRAAMRKWESSLSLWQKFNWRIGAIAPRNRPVTIDFLPGEIDLGVPRADIPHPSPAPPDSPRTTA